MTERVLGLDLSLRATAMALVPADWGCEWSRVVVGAVGQSLPKTAVEHARINRLDVIVGGVLDFARRHGATRVFVEQYAFSAMASQAHSLGELGGVVKRELWRAGLPIEVVPPASARKLLGKMPRRDVKVHVRGLLTQMGAPVAWNMDQADAFVVANWGLSELGAPCLIARAA